MDDIKDPTTNEVDSLTTLSGFVIESNRIEGIIGATETEIEAHTNLIRLPVVRVEDLCNFVAIVARGHVLRDKPGLNVRVGYHIPPPGGPEIRGKLAALLATPMHPYDKHLAYETLHPFTDGNGRSGRALWLHGMYHLNEPVVRTFLHEWYYQSLSHSRVVPATYCQRMVLQDSYCSLMAEHIGPCVDRDGFSSETMNSRLLAEQKLQRGRE